MAFIAAFDAYLLAPASERDQAAVRDLCTAALEELIPGLTGTEGEEGRSHPRAPRYRRDY